MEEFDYKALQAKVPEQIVSGKLLITGKSRTTIFTKSYCNFHKILLQFSQFKSFVIFVADFLLIRFSFTGELRSVSSFRKLSIIINLKNFYYV